MNRYHVQFFLGKKVVAQGYADGWTRHDAMVKVMETQQYRRAVEMARKKFSTLMWDATLIKEGLNG
jgi:hypothetical protein